MRRLFPSLLLSLAATVCGCGEGSASAPSGPAVAVPAEATPSPFTPGRVSSYRFSWTQNSQGRGPAILPESVPVTGGLELSGLLQVRVLAPRDGATVLDVSLERVDDAQLRVFEQNVLTDPHALEGVHAYVEVPPQGETRRVFFPAETPELGRELLAGVLGRLDLRQLEDGPTEATVVSTQGLAHAEYARRGTLWQRRLTEDVRLDADRPVGAGAPRREGHGTLQLADDGGIERVVNEDILVVPSHHETPHLRAETHFEAQREAVFNEAVQTAPAFDGLLADDLLGPPDDAAARAELGRRFAQGLTSFDAAMTIRAAGNGLAPQRGFAVRAVGMLRGWPERARDLIEIYEADPEPRARMLVVDLLASANTPQSQAVMIQLLESEAARGDALYPTLVQRFAFVSRPTPESAEFLLRSHEATRTEGRDEARLALLYPMGSLAAAVASTDPVLAEALVERIRDDEAEAETLPHREAAIAGLGNAARPRDLDILLAATHDRESAIRGMAALGLQHQLDPRAESRLLEMLADPEPYVARQALVALESQPRPDGADRLAAVALAGAYAPAISYELGDAIYAEPGTHELARAALIAMHTRAPDPKTARDLRRWIEAV
jgi:HEAT repeat protein